jgi:serine/threonine-protein kinase
MNTQQTARFLALLVHRGLVTAADAKRALASGDPQSWLVDAGVVTFDGWQEWVATDAGTRPKLARYELGDKLGEGGEGVVFRAVDRVDKREVALKILRAEVTRDRQALARFIAESKLLIELDCPHIVKGYRVAREGDNVYCAMEVVDGECLQDRLARDGRLDEETALQVVGQIAMALAHMQERGLVHRDVKPGNILWTDEGRAVLIDLGFAVAGTTESTTTAGTVHYIAPEQARGTADLDVRADIYSLGATLYHLVTGSLPFSGESSQEVMAKQVLESLSGERIRAMDLSQQVHWLIEKMMAKEKEIRFQSPSELAKAVSTCLQRLEQERVERRTDRGPSRRPRRRWL